MDCFHLYILIGAEMILLFPIDDKDGEGKRANILLFNHLPQWDRKLTFLVLKLLPLYISQHVLCVTFLHHILNKRVLPLQSEKVLPREFTTIYLLLFLVGEKKSIWIFFF